MASPELEPKGDAADDEEQSDARAPAPGVAAPRSARSSAREALVASGDVEGLLSLARAYRAGTSDVRKDLAECLACYEAASEHGSEEAAYAVALFYLTGGVVSQDLKAGVSHLRIAADLGSVSAKVYLANLYEQGIHYAKDESKADVWYRSAARAANVTLDPESSEYAEAMAELGGARYALEIAKDDSGSAEKREHYLRKARAYGLGLRERQPESREPAPPSAPAPAPPAEPAIAPVAAAAPPAADPVPSVKGPPAVAPVPAAAKKPTPPRKSPLPIRRAFVAFFFEALFLGAALGSSVLALEGGRALLAQGRTLPAWAVSPHVVVPALTAIVGVFPSFLLYRGITVVRALAAAAALGGLALALWGGPHVTWFADKDVQMLAVGTCTFLAALLVMGPFGGVKPERLR